MERQEDRLRASDWNVLVVLDSCRADVFRERVPEAETVRSPGTHTANWSRAMFRGGLVPDGTVWTFCYEWPRLAWLEMGARAPDVVMRRPPGGRTWAPLVNDRIWTWMERHGQPAHTVAHYLWPHWPYDFAPFAAAAMSVQALYRRRVATAEQLRAAYRQNLDYVLGHVIGLLSMVRGRVVITADHGEVLGERKRDGEALWGHYEDVDCPELREVPWLEIDCGDFEPDATLPPHPRATEVDLETEHETIIKNLRALGYVE